MYPYGLNSKKINKKEFKEFLGTSNVKIVKILID